MATFRRQVFCLQTSEDTGARLIDERTVAASSAEGEHRFGVDLASEALDAGFSAASMPLIEDLLAGKPTLLVMQGDDSDGTLVRGLAARLLGLLFQRMDRAPEGVACTLTLSCVAANDARIGKCE